MTRQVRELILDGKTEMNRFEKSSTNLDIQPSVRLGSLPINRESNESPIQTISLSDIMSKWEATPIEPTEIISQAVPILFAMNLSMTATFQMDAMNVLHSKDWTKTQAVVAIGASALVAFNGAGIIYPIWLACMAAFAVGASVTTAFYRYFAAIRHEYLKILLFVAQSIGLSTNKIRIHPYILDKEIRGMYHDRISTYSNDDYIIANWNKFFPMSKLISSTQKPVIQYWLNLVKCVDAHYRLSKLLPEDFAVGVVGGGKTDKSQLFTRMFGFATQPDLNLRTEEMASYRISNQFRVVDFPHMNSSIDALKRYFTCHHTMVNAIIVVLNGEQRGDDVQTEGYVIETVKKLAAEPDGVDILFCLNRDDRLALCKPRAKSHGIKKREQPSLQSSGAISNQRSVYWTEEDVRNNKNEFATRAYGLKPENCMVTFFALDNDDDPN